MSHVIQLAVFCFLFCLILQDYGADSWLFRFIIHRRNRNHQRQRRGRRVRRIIRPPRPPPPRPPSQCVCSASGDPHYKTYDGAMIHFQGICRYTLTKSTLPKTDKCYFNVEVLNEHRGRNRRVSYTRTVFVNMYNDHIRMDKRNVFVDGRWERLPFERIRRGQKQYFIARVGNKIRVENPACRFETEWDGHHQVIVRVLRNRHSNKMIGICGNCNRNRHDDFKTKGGRMVNRRGDKYRLIGKSYEVSDRHRRGRCTTGPPPKGCTPALKREAKADKYCGYLNPHNLGHNPFSSCLRKLKSLAQQRYENCLYDFCSYARENKRGQINNLICQALDGFSQVCARHNKKVKRWRKANFCAPHCRKHQIYSYSMSGCPATCVAPGANRRCNFPRGEGCMCRNGYVLSGRDCVPKKKCGCKEGGRYYPLGSTIKTCTQVIRCVRRTGRPRLIKTRRTHKCGRNSKCVGYTNKDDCRCKRGFVRVGLVCRRKHVRKCTCSASGDPHYKTYDGQMIHFQGTCKYTLTKSLTKNDQCAFNVEVKNEHRGRNKRVSYTKSVFIDIKSDKIELVKNRITINGRRVYGFNKKYVVTRNGRGVTVNIPDCHIYIFWNTRSLVTVSVPKGKYGGKMTGLCGDCNGKRDDFRTKLGKDVRRSRNKYTLIGKSYQVQGTGRCAVITPPHHCTKAERRSADFKRNCGFLKPGLRSATRFSQCIRNNRGMATKFYNDCIYDYCAFVKGQKRFRKGITCSSIAAFADACNKLGFPLRWRRSNFCPLKCGKHKKYVFSMSGCPATCLNPSSERKCRLPRTDGCKCVRGYILSGNTCVRKRKCGCTDRNGRYYLAGTSFLSRGCKKKYECRNGKLRSKKRRFCGRNSRCLLKWGKYQCSCKRGYRLRGGVCKRKHIRKCTCSASGDPHYKTYDGQMIHFQGTCKYTLTKSLTKNDPCAFNIQVKNEHRGRNKRVSYTKSVIVHIKGDTIRMVKGSVTINRRGVYGYFKKAGKYTVAPCGRGLQLNIPDCGITVFWDKRSMVRVSVPGGKYGGKMTGLCGDCNGKRDDFRTRLGKDVRRSRNKYTLIGRSYQVHGQGRCAIIKPPHHCTTKERRRADNKQNCGYMNPDLRIWTPFKKCIMKHKRMARMFYKDCIYDFCALARNRKRSRGKATCRSIAAFADACATKGIRASWRKTGFCPLKCGPHMTYTNSMSACPATCADRLSELKCPFRRTEGCMCNRGFILSGNKCVRRKKCGCQGKEGRYYPEGTSFFSRTCGTKYRCSKGLLISDRRRYFCRKNSRCVLFQGKFQCRCKRGYRKRGGVCKRKQVKKCRCTASGDPHYRTYDGQMIHFQGTCRYTLTKSLTLNDRCGFNIEVKNQHRGRNKRVSYTKSVYIKTRGDTIKLVKRIVLVNRIAIYGYMKKRNKYTIARSAKGIFVELPGCDIDIFWDMNSKVTVTVPQNRYGGKMTGICGDCNGKRDDFRTRLGKDVRKSRNKYILIGKSYQVQGLGRCAITKPPHHCTRKERRRARRMRNCGHLNPKKWKKSPFKRCILNNKRMAKQFYKDCIYDFCAFARKKKRSRHQAVCRSVTAFADECAAKGLGARWRKKRFCPMRCGRNMVYSASMSACPASCADPLAAKKCKFPRTEGCRCKRGFILSGNSCVRRGKCGCRGTDGLYYPNKLTIFSPGCTTKRRCVSGHLRPLLGWRSCGRNSRCVIFFGRFQCRCRRGFRFRKGVCKRRKPKPKRKCYLLSKGTDYRGRLARTEKGIKCQSWKSNKPHRHHHHNLPRNYCRNPDNSARPWCYTTDPKIRWQYCNLKRCKRPRRECLKSIQGKHYNGRKSKTQNGYTCQRWASQHPHRHSPKFNSLAKNYCRNPDSSKRPWCYTTDPRKRWDYCKIRMCGARKCRCSIKQVVNRRKRRVVYKMTGNCRFRTTRPSFCKYRIRLYKSGGRYKAFIKVRGKRRFLTNGQKHKSCATFFLRGRRLIVIDRNAWGFLGKKPKVLPQLRRRKRKGKKPRKRKQRRKFRFQW